MAAKARKTAAPQPQAPEPHAENPTDFEPAVKRGSRNRKNGKTVSGGGSEGTGNIVLRGGRGVV